MPIRTIPGTAATYGLIAFDKNGAERRDDPNGIGGQLSAKLLDDIRANGHSDIFLYSHGWKGDVPAAIEQYDRWIKAIDGLDADRARLKERFPAFKPLHIGLHWPSLPWGDEEIGAAGAAFAAAGGVIDLVNTYAARLDDTPRVRAALQTILEEARSNVAADTLSDEARAAYVDLNDALDLGEEGVGGDPGSDRQPFDPDRAMEQGNEEGAVDFGGFNLGGVLGPLRQLSFWTMKKRGRVVGESGMHAFLLDVLRAGPQARVHLMGHSFGCVVVSSMLAGPRGNAPLPRPVESCVLVQGAMSLWSYCGDIPDKPGTPGYCHSIIRDRKVRGPIVTTRSRFDRAVGTFYPLAAGAAGQVDFAPGAFPTYGGTGSFGLQAIPTAKDLRMLAKSGAYEFAAGGVYNIEASEFISHGGGASGAHSDIAGPEVAHVIWSAALAQ